MTFFVFCDIIYRKLRKGDLYDAALQNIDIFCEEEEETMKENKDGTHIGELLLATFLHAFVKNFMSEEL